MQLSLVFPPSGCIKSASQSVQTCASTTTPLSQLLFWTENLRYRMFFVGRSICPHSHLVSQLWGEKSRIIMLIYSRTSCCVKMTLQTTSLKVLMSSPLLGTGTMRSQKSRCVLQRVHGCVCVLIFTTQQEVSEKITSHCHIMSTKTNEQQHTHTDCLQASTPCDL